MKILALMTFDIFRLSLGEALRQLGHEVTYLGEFDACTLNARIKEIRPDMIIDMGWDVWQQDKHVHGNLEAIRKVIKRHRLFHLYFAEEDWLHFERWSKRYCEIMRPNFVLTRSPLTIRRYEEMGIKAAYFDVGCNPSLHKPGPLDERYRCDIAVVANGNFTIGEMRYKSINDLIVPLTKLTGYEVKIWGRDWDVIDRCYPGAKLPSYMLQGILPFAETAAVYRSAKISISLQTSNDQLSNRSMDILASGGVMLTSDTKAVREKLRPGSNCIVSSSPEETIERIDYYLKNDSKRQQIARQGMRVAVNQFAYQRTLPRVWPEIEREWRDFRKNGYMPSPENLLVNGRFQHSDLAWKTVNTSFESTGGYGSSGQAKFNGGTDNAYIQQKVQVVPNRTYLLTARFAISEAGSGAPINIFVQYYTADGQLLGFGLYHSLFATDMTEDWVSYRGITTKVPAEACYALILINKISLEQSVPVVVSDCRMIEISI